MPIVIPVEIDSSSFEAGIAELESKAKKAGKDLGDDIEKGGKKATKSMVDAGKAAEDLGDVAGLPVDKIKKLASGFAALGNPAGIAAAAVAAVALAGVAMAAGIVGCVTAAEDLVKALEPISDNEGFGFSKDQVAQVQAANDALKAIGVIVKQVVARLGVEFAPVVDRVSTLLVKFGLMALDAFNYFADGHDILRELARFLIGTMIDAMTPVIASLVSMANVMAKLARAAGQDGLANQLDKVKEGWDDFKNAVSDKILDYLVDGFDSLDTATGSYDERAKKLIGSMKNLSTTAKSAATATKALKSTFSDSVKIMDEDNALTEKTAGLIDSLTASARKSYEERLTGEDAIKASLEDQLASLQTIYQQAIQNATSDQQRTDATTQYEEARTQAILTAEQKIQEAQKKTADDAVKAAEDAAQKTQDAWLNAVSGVQGGLASIVGLIGGPVAGAVAGLILNLQDTVSGLLDEIKSLPKIIKSIPKLAVKLVTGILDALPALLKAIPALIDGLIDAIPKIAVALVVGIINAIPALIQVAVKLIVTYLAASSGYLAIKIVVAIIKGLFDAFKSFWDKFSSGELIAGLKAAALEAVALFFVRLRAGIEDAINAVKSFFTVDFWKDVWQGLKDVLKELLTLGAGKTKTFGDSPGVQRAGPQGDTVRTSPGDYYLAGRDPQSLLAQALAGLGGAPAPAPAYAGGGQINFAHQHRAFDGFFVRHAMLGGQTSQFFKSFFSGKDARGLR